LPAEKVILGQYNRLLVGALLASAFPVRASAQVAEPPPALTTSGGLTLVSQYRFRGIGLSDEKAALQGTLNLNHKSGAYAGAWASSLDGFGELGGSNLELDLFGGYRHEVAKGVTLDTGLLYYAYPGSRGGKFEFFEPYANVSGKIGPATTKVGAAFAPAQDAIGGNSNIYLFNDNSLPIAGTPISLTSHVGWSKGRTTLTPGGDYLDWSLGAQASWRNLTAGVAYVDTDISRRDALAAGASKTIVDGAVVLSVGASF
jgi:uncharacterized protein (TIGR02001 family)